MDLRRLRYFLAVAEEGSFRRAAQRLNVAQPALSHHVRALEDELGVPLLLRGPRGVAVTDHGEELRQHARRWLHEMEGVRAALRGAEAEPAGPVTVGIPTSLGMALSVPLALEVRRRLPKVRLRVVEGLSGHTLEWLRGGAVDLALVFNAEGVPGLVLRPVASERLHLVAPAGDALLRDRKAIPFETAAELPLILPGRPHGLREELEAVAARARRPLNIALEMDALEHIKALVRRGAGYTVLSRRVAAPEIAAGHLAALPLAPEIRRSVTLAHAADRPLTAAARRVHALLSDQLDGMTAGGRWRDAAWSARTD